MIRARSTDRADKIVGIGKRTAFWLVWPSVNSKLHKQREALREAAGCWKPENHPELAEGRLMGQQNPL
jgi:hypothetical protein